MNKFVKILKRCMFILLFIISFPFLLIYYVIKKLSHIIKYKSWKNNGTTARELLFTVDTNNMLSLEDYELDEYIKYLFFYCGYKVKKLSNKTNNTEYVISKDGMTYYLKNAFFDNKSLKNTIKSLNSKRNSLKIQYGIILSNKHIDPQQIELLRNDYIQVLNLEGLKPLILIAQKEIRDIPELGENIGLTINEAIDKMYPYKI